jgi:hypothetical protein
MKQQRYKAVASMLLAVLLGLAASVKGYDIAAALERAESGAQYNGGRTERPVDPGTAEIGGSTVLWVLGGGLVVVSLVARRRSTGAD